MVHEKRDQDPHLFATDWYEDITDELRKQANELGPGGVVMEPGVQMYQALPAFQIGSPKIDTGPPQEFKLLETEFAAAALAFPLTTDDSAAELMDRMLEAEIAWHEGYSLIQTVLACVLLESDLQKLTFAKLNNAGVPVSGLTAQLAGESNAVVEIMNEVPSSVAADVLKVFNLSMIKAVEMTTELCGGAGAAAVYQEEDMHILRYNLYGLEDTPVQYIVELLERAKKRAAQQGFKKCAERLGLRITWLTVLKQRVPKKLANLDRLASQIEAWKGSTTTTTKGKGALAWFGTGAQARLDGACLRQPLVETSRDRASSFWLRIVDALRALVPVYRISRSVDLLGFFLAFSSRREPPIVRAIAKTLSPSATQLLSQSAKQWTLMDINETIPPPGFSSGNAKQSRRLDEFLGQACLCYTDLITIFCRNRSRMREGLLSLVVSLDSLQVAADQLDGAMHAAKDRSAHTLALADGSQVPAMYFSSWTYFRKLQVMLWSVLLCFETDVVSYGEMAYTYWYSTKLCDALLQHLNRMRTAFEQHGSTNNGNARDSPGYSFLVALELESQMLQQVTTAEHMLWTALHKLKPPQGNPNVSRDMQFALRFRDFSSVGVPEMLNLADFDEFSNNLDITTAIQGAGTAARSARTLLATLEKLAAANTEISLLKRSVIGLSVAIASVVKLGNAPIKIEMDRDEFHWYFPVPKISPDENSA